MGICSPADQIHYISTVMDTGKLAHFTSFCCCFHLELYGEGIYTCTATFGLSKVPGSDDVLINAKYSQEGKKMILEVCFLISSEFGFCFLCLVLSQENDLIKYLSVSKLL